MPKHSAFLIAAAVGSLAAPALAGGFDTPVMEPIASAPMAQPAMAPSTNWTGPYVGVQAGVGDTSFSFDGVDGFESDTQHFGLHAGYLYDLGSFVVGESAVATYTVP